MAMSALAKEIASIRYLELSTGRLIWERYEFLEKTQWLTSDKIRQMQLEKLKKLISYAYNNVPYYRKEFDRAGFKPVHLQALEDLKKIPILTRENLRKYYPSALMARNRNHKGGFEDATGGTSGGPTRYFVGKRSAAYRTARTLRYQKWYGFYYGQPKALVWGSQRDLLSRKTLVKKIQSILMNTITMNAWQMDEARMRGFYDKICRVEPKVIEAYAGSLYIFARFLDEQDLEIPGPIHPVISAEKIEESQRDFIEEVFHSPSTNRYGTRELGAIAQECAEHDGLHISSENLLVEEVELGDGVSELVITNLENFSMPFVRYAIGDTGELSSQDCICGRGLPRIKEIGGRVTDLIVTPSGSFISGIVFPHRLRHFEPIEEFQVMQVDRTQVTLKLQLNRPLKKEEKADMRRTIEEVLPDSMTLDIEVVDEIPLAPSGKRLLVHSEIAREYSC
jgi:phenylacetate-CoA ligase